MPSAQLHPYQPLEEVRRVVDRFHVPHMPVVHPLSIIERARAERSAFSRFNGVLADHIVGLAGTMLFFYVLCALLGGWTLWQAGIEHDNGFDPFPFAFLFFILGGIMQSLFVPTMLTASNRAAERDRIKDEADHRAWTHLYEVNEEQLSLLRKIAAAVAVTDGQDEPGKA